MQPFRRSQLIAAIVFLLAVKLSLSAAGQPDFTGTWKLNAQRSDFAQLPAPSVIVDKITREVGAFVIDRTRDRENFTLRVPFDGAVAENTMRAMKMKTHAKWAADTLVVTYAGSRMGSAVNIEERWTLSSDGKTWTIVKNLSGGPGAATQTIVMERQ